jgi:hypothetical protein
MTRDREYFGLFTFPVRLVYELGRSLVRRRLSPFFDGATWGDILGDSLVILLGPWAMFCGMPLYLAYEIAGAILRGSSIAEAILRAFPPT